ncbi:hypothetical protein Tco_0990127, partial [Tanacetum coccineum]
IGDHGISKVKEHNVVSGDVREALPRMAPGPFRGKNHLVTDKIRDRGLSKVNEHTVVSGGVRGALPSMAPEPFRGKSCLVTDKLLVSEDIDRLGGGSKKRTLNEDLEDHLEVNSRRTDIHIDGPQSEEHIGSTSNDTTVMRKETSALSATKRNRLNNRKLVFEVDDCAGRIVGEDSQTFITMGGCLQQTVFMLVLYRENSSFNLNCQSMARAINSQLASQHKSRRWRLHNHYKNYPTKEQAIMNPPRGVKIPDWEHLCDRFACRGFSGYNFILLRLQMELYYMKHLLARFPFLDEDVIRILLDIPLKEIADLCQPSGVCIKQLSYLKELFRFEVNHKMTNVVPAPPMDPPNTLDRSSYGESVGHSLQLSGTAFEFQSVAYK